MQEYDEYNSFDVEKHSFYTKNRVKYGMATQSVKLKLFLKEVWSEAYKDNQRTFDYTGQDYAEQRLTRLKACLYNYRRGIRNKKLNPDYCDQWGQMLACEIVVESPTRLTVRRTHKLIFTRKLQALQNMNDNPKLPVS